MELPVAFDALTVVVNPANTWVKSLTVADLKKMWEPAAQGRVTKWNQVRPEWPEQNLMLFGPGADSGTFDYFTEAVTGKSKASRGDFTASEDDNVLVQGVAGDDLGLGFLPFAYYNEYRERLKLVPVDNGKGGGPIAPSFETIRTGEYSPLSRPLFIYVSAKSQARPEVQQFVDFYVATVGSLAQEVGYVELPKDRQ
jgi:phosphate transport system substrate-binding protein